MMQQSVYDFCVLHFFYVTRYFFLFLFSFHFAVRIFGVRVLFSFFLNAKRRNFTKELNEPMMVMMMNKKNKKDDDKRETDGMRERREKKKVKCQ